MFALCGCSSDGVSSRIDEVDAFPGLLSSSAVDIGGGVIEDWFDASSLCSWRSARLWAAQFCWMDGRAAAGCVKLISHMV